MRFAADENLDGRILAGLRKRLPELDIVRVQDTEMRGASDDVLLAWLADAGRILLTHDVQTMPGYAYERVYQGLPMLGVIEIHDDTPISQALDELEIMLVAGKPEDFANQVRFIPITS